MEIRWQGKSFFEVSSAYGNILINPSDNNSEATQLFSGFNLNPHKDKKVNIIDSPGEYEIKGIAIRGIPSPLTEPSLSRDINVIYVVDIENIRLCVLGYPGHELSAQVIQQIGKIDILILDGSSSSLEINELASMIRSLLEMLSSDETVFTCPRSTVFSSSDNFFRLTLSFNSISIFIFPASAASIF